MKLRPILERILATVLFVLLITAFFIFPYLITRTVFGAFLFIIGFIATVLLGYLFSIKSIGTAKSLGEKTRKASSSELYREDDVLLKGVALSQSVFFIYLNLIPGSDFITVFKILIPIFAVVFYVLRGWGRIKNDSKYRYWSIWVLVFIVLNTILWSSYALITLSIGFKEMEIWGYFIVQIYASVMFGSMRFVKEIFRKRYGYQ